MIGQRVEKYTIREEIGQGGMAVVYRAEDSVLKRDVAIKILHPHLMRQEAAVERFRREAVTVARLQHPNIIEIYDYSGENSAQLFIVTELIDGVTLAEFMASRDPLPCELVACLGLELCQALDHAHKQGIVHRDLKPENVMIRRDGKVKLMDFGIARALEGASMTMTGSILGSPAFMSPEHIAGKDVDARSDLFSLGSILYYMATGVLPFSGRNPAETLKKVSESRVAPAQAVNPTISNRFGRILDRLLQVDPTQRYASASDLCCDLEELTRQSGIVRPAEEVHHLFADPDHYPAVFITRIMADLEKQAEASLRKAPALAMQLYNRLLAFDPENTLAQRQLDRLLSRQRWRTRGSRALIATVLLAGLAVTVWLLFHRLADMPSSAPETDNEGKVSASFPSDSPAPEDPSAAAIDPTPAARNLAQRTPPKPKPVVSKRIDRKPATVVKREDKPGLPSTSPEAPVGDFTGTLKVVTSPWADIYVDDRKVGNSQLDANKRYELSAGQHRIRLINPACEPVTETVTVERAGQMVEIRRRLSLRPALLDLKNSQSAMVFIDGEFRGRTPLAAPLTVRWEEQVSSRRVMVSLTKAGFQPVNQTLTMTAGNTTQVELELTPQEGAP